MTNQNNRNILFVSDLPKETTFEDLAEFFSKYNFQYATLNNSKASTWAQVYFENDQYATKAKNDLNGEILLPKLSNDKQGKPIRICKFEKRGAFAEKNIKQSLLVKNLDKRMTQKEFYQIFFKYGDIESAKVDYDEMGISKGFGYIYYTTPESAENAKMNLNGKDFYGKRLDIVNLIPLKSKDFTNSLFVKNFPADFRENELRKLFEKYGDIKHVSIARDQSGHSKGYGFISFTEFEMASRCLTETNKNETSFPGLLPLCVKYATRKEDRETKNIGATYSSDLLKIQFNLNYMTDSIDSPFDLEKSIRLFIKVIMLQEYNPKEVVVDFADFSGVVTLNSRRDYEQYFKMYEEFCSSHGPSFLCVPYSVRKEPKPMIIAHNPGINTNMNNNTMPFSNHPKNESIPVNRNIQQMPIGNNTNNSQLFPNMILLNNDMAPRQNKIPNNVNVMQKPTMIPVAFPRPPGNQIPMNTQQGYLEHMNNIPIWPGNIPIQHIPIPMRQPFQPPMIKMINPNNQNNMNFNNNQIPYMLQQEAINNQQYLNNMETKMNNTQNFQQPKRRNDDFDPRNLQIMNSDQLQSQFNKPAQHIFNPEMFNHDDNEEIANEIADSIYEIVYKKYPSEAAKITGMIREMGIQKMNLLLSKMEDLTELIDKGYEMIHKDN